MPSQKEMIWLYSYNARFNLKYHSDLVFSFEFHAILRKNYCINAVLSLTGIIDTIFKTNKKCYFLKLKIKTKSQSY